MTEFILNSKAVKTASDKNLLHFLREDLKITSVKDGCSAGACGTCTVLVEGKAKKACLVKLPSLSGLSVTTVEGLSEVEKDAYVSAFAQSGAVQCGFCIPGMVMCAKALLDVNPNPGPEDIKKAIRGNICRCTGYVKIEAAIMLAAKILRGESIAQLSAQTARLGDDFPRVDAADKVLGTGLYVDDIVVEDMLHASALRSKYPRAKILSINTAKALAHQDCEAVLTADDVPGNNKIGHLEFVSDWDVMIKVGDITRYIGDAVALVVSRKKESLDAIKALVEVNYEELTPLTSPSMALAKDAPFIHEKGNILSRQELKRGNADEVIKNSKYVVTQKYSVPFTEHAFMEPECAIAMPDGPNGLKLYTGGQSIYDEQREIARMLGIEQANIHVVGQYVGGGFGGKEDMSVQHHAALVAWCLKKPVKVLLTREESIMVHPKRHAMEMEFTTACGENGFLTAVKATIVSDTGAYASLGGPVLQRACTHAAGPYNYQVVDIVGTAVYTNNPPAGAFRGFGVCQSAFATENNLNLLAEMVGITPWEIRHRNAILPGQVLPSGQIADESTGLVECLEALKDVYHNAKTAGIAASYKNSGLGVGVPDIGRCILSIEKGKVHIRTSAACMGQGMATVNTQIVCETLGITPELVFVEPPDTRRTPNSGTSTASRQTVFTGEATRRAAMIIKQKLNEGKTLADLEGEEFFGEYSAQTDPMDSPKPNPVSHVAYGYAAEVVELDEEGRITNITAAYDMGSVINPKAAEGQIEGGIVMGIGYALTEDFPVEGGYPKLNYGTLGLLRSTSVPPMNIIVVQGPGKNKEAYGAKGVGELATIPTAPAICGAYYALDGVLRNELPMKNTYYSKSRK